MLGMCWMLTGPAVGMGGRYSVWVRDVDFPGQGHTLKVRDWVCEGEAAALAERLTRAAPPVARVCVLSCCLQQAGREGYGTWLTTWLTTWHLA